VKTSINVPDWLHEDVTALAPEVPFGEMVRDALIIALPVWTKAAAGSAAEIPLRARLRFAEANAAQERVRRVALEAAEQARRDRRAKPKRAPATRPKSHPDGDRQSDSKARSRSRPARSKRSSPGPSPRS